MPSVSQIFIYVSTEKGINSIVTPLWTRDLKEVIFLDFKFLRGHSPACVHRDGGVSFKLTGMTLTELRNLLVHK